MKKNLIGSSLVIFIFSFFINFQSANIGVLPIDTFAFFDTGYLVSKGAHPIKDFWATTGILVDYLQALYFYIFGVNWFAYVLHASSMNFLLSIFFFTIFYKNNLSIKLSLFYSLAISILFYPIVGTPFAYQHALLFSTMSFAMIYLILKKNNKFLWISLPLCMLTSFLCMQTPSAYVNVLIIIFLIYYFLKNKNYGNLKYFFLGSLISIFILIFYFYYSKVPIDNFLYQYILFPLSIGLDRLASSEGAFVTLKSKFSLKSVIFDFKLIYLVLLIFTFSVFSNLKSKKTKAEDKTILIFIVVTSFTLIIIFNQLVTANQIYIFSLIPILAALTNIEIIEGNKKNITITKIFLIIIVSFSSYKYLDRFIIDRKFIDLENTNLIKSFDAKKISPKFKDLNWITLHFHNDPEKELKNLNIVIDKISEDERKKMVISHYQFFSAILDQNLNNLNRWYTNDNNSYPLQNHKFSKVYEEFINKKIKDNKIEVIYIIDSTGKGRLKISNFNKYLNEICFLDEIIVKDFFSSHSIKNCD